MSGQIKRREFLKKSAVLSAATVLGNSVVPGLAFSKNAVDIAVVKGQNYFNTTLKAVELLGGMEKFVPPRANVAILANPAGNNPGTFTKPEIVQAVIQMCKGAGANKIRCIGWLPLSASTALPAFSIDEAKIASSEELSRKSMSKPATLAPAAFRLSRACACKLRGQSDHFP